MKFLIDENLPPRLAAWLNARGHDAAHIREFSLLGASDEAVTALARSQDRVVITQDADFAPPPVGIRVLRLGVGNMPTQALVAWLETRLGAAITQIENGAQIVTLE